MSTPFSMLFLILLTDFRKKRKFPSKYANYVNTAFVFGKKLKAILYIERFNVGLHIHSFTHFRAHFSFG